MMAIIVVDETKTVDAASAVPGVYGSTTMKGEVLIKTHSHMDPQHAFHGGQWINLYGTYGFTPDKVHPAMIYDDPTEEEINESRKAGAKGTFDGQSIFKNVKNPPRVPGDNPRA